APDPVVGQIARLEFKHAGIGEAFGEEKLLNIAGDFELFPESFLFQLFASKLFIFDGYDNNVAQRLNKTQSVLTFVTGVIFIDSADKYDCQCIALMRHRDHYVELSKLIVVVAFEAGNPVQGLEVLRQLRCEEAGIGSKI